MPEEIKVLAEQMDASLVQRGNIEGKIENNTGEISGTLARNEGDLSGLLESLEEVQYDGGVSLVNGSVSGEVVNETPELTARLSARYGADGAPGKDGFSPTISIHKQDKKTYILEITDVNGSYYTPNLMGGHIIADGKVDEDLAKYREFDPTTLTRHQRKNSFLYVRRDDLDENTKISLDHIALTKEVDTKIRQKLQTVNERPTNDWKVGDYIFLETGDGDK